MIVTDSSNIASIDWQQEDVPGVPADRPVGHLVVTFRNNRVYRYDDVPQEVYADLERTASSPGASLGSRFNQTVKTAGFECEEITDAVV